MTTGCVYLAEKMISGRILPAETMSYCSFEALTSGRKLKCPCSPLLPEILLFEYNRREIGKNIVRTLNNFIFKNVFIYMPHLYNMQLKIHIWFKKTKFLYNMAFQPPGWLSEQPGWHCRVQWCIQRPVHKAICPGYQRKEKYCSTMPWEAWRSEVKGMRVFQWCSTHTTTP